MIVAVLIFRCLHCLYYKRSYAYKALAGRTKNDWMMMMVVASLIWALGHEKDLKLLSRTPAPASQGSRLTEFQPPWVSALQGFRAPFSHSLARSPTYTNRISQTSSPLLMVFFWELGV